MQNGAYNLDFVVIQNRKGCVVYKRGNIVTKTFISEEESENYYHECDMNLILHKANSQLLLLLSAYDDQSLSFEMPYCDWPALKSVYVKDLPSDYKAAVWNHLIDAVSVIHQFNLAHNDLHPGNMLVSPKFPYLKIIDFGETNHIGFPCIYEPWIFRNPKMPFFNSSFLNDYWSIAIMYFLLGDITTCFVTFIENNIPRIDHYHILQERLSNFLHLQLAQGLLSVLHDSGEKLKNLFGAGTLKMLDHKFIF